LAYLQRLPGEGSVAGQVGNSRSIGSLFKDKGRLRAFFKDTLLKSGELLSLS